MCLLGSKHQLAAKTKAMLNGKEWHCTLFVSLDVNLALENLYFGYMLLLSAVSVARERLLRFEIASLGKVEKGSR